MKLPEKKILAVSGVASAATCSTVKLLNLIFSTILAPTPLSMVASLSQTFLRCF